MNWNDFTHGIVIHGNGLGGGTLTMFCPFYLSYIKKTLLQSYFTSMTDGHDNLMMWYKTYFIGLDSAIGLDPNSNLIEKMQIIVNWKKLKPWSLNCVHCFIQILILNSSWSKAPKLERQKYNFPIPLKI